MHFHFRLFQWVTFVSLSCFSFAGTPDPLRTDAAAALERAVTFFRSQVAVNGTYLWQYSADLSKREGEGKAAPTQGWIQPPGTPAVGMAFLKAWNATSNALYLDAARETVRGLVRAQLRSGGWHYGVDFDSVARHKIAFRVDGAKGSGRNVSTFDDDTTQAALRFLARYDRAAGYKDDSVREPIRYAFSSVFKSQFPNGAWSQGYETFPDPAQFPVVKASAPVEWPRTWPGSKRYWLNYTLNDNSMATLIDTLFEVAAIYGDASAGKELNAVAQQCRAAAVRAGDFLLLAQMPEPQPAWAQQYDSQMHPVWARKFEPPAISGGESQGVLRTLIKVYRATGDRKYLEPIPRALAYFRRSRLADGRLARFYEMGSNKPLYFTRDYQLTYDDSDVPTHYSFKVIDNTEAIAREFEAVKTLSPSQLSPSVGSGQRVTAAQIKEIVAAQDNRGAWVEEGRLKYHGPNDDTTRVIRCATFNRNVEALAEFLQAK